MLLKSVSYILIFSFLLTASGCYTTKNYSDTPEILIAKEKGKKDIVYDDLDSMTLINNKIINLDLHTAQFIKSRTDSSYKFVYFYPRVVFDTTKMLALKSNKAYYKDAVPDTLDIHNISMIHYTISKLDNEKTALTIGLSILFAACSLFNNWIVGISFCMEWFKTLMNKKLITYSLLFSFLLTVSGCYTTKYYSETPENMIEKEKGRKVIYEDLDSMTLIDNKTYDLSDYDAWFSKKLTDSSYKFVYYYPRQIFDSVKMIATKSKTAFYKNSVPDTLDISRISFLHYTESKMLSRTYTYIILGIGIPAFILFFIAMFSIPWGGVG